MKKQIKFSAVLAVLLQTGGVWLAFSNANATAADQFTPTSAPAAVPTSDLPVADSPGVLDARRQFALGMIETGADDNEIGGAGEISRYQIMPSVWRHYSQSCRYRDPAVASAVAQRHWAALCDGFKQQTHREPTDFDMYVLWNTRYGYYASRGFQPTRLHATVRDRARRFVNLVERDAPQRPLASGTVQWNAERRGTTENS